MFDAALAAGHEGVVVKALDAPYAAGRRGSGWLKVKPVHTLDLVVGSAAAFGGREARTVATVSASGAAFLVVAVALHAREAQRHPGRVARRRLHAVERDLDDELGPHVHDDARRGRSRARAAARSATRAARR